MSTDRVHPKPRRHADPVTDQSVTELRNAVELLNRSVDELEKKPGNRGQLIQGVVLVSGAPGAIVKVKHGLKRKLQSVSIARMVIGAAVAAAGSVVEIQDDGAGSTVDDSKEVWLRAIGFGGAVNVTVAVLVN